MTFKSVAVKANPAEFFPDVETFVLNGEVCPGQATLISAVKKFGWQINKGWGLTGATVVPTGDELVVAKFSILIWDEVTDWPKFRAFRKKYLGKALAQVPNGVTPKAYGISHPELADQGVTQVVTLTIGAATNDGTGGHEIEVEFLQYRKAKPALAKPDAAIPSKGSPSPSAQDAADREMQAKTTEIQNLGNQLAGKAQ